MRPLRVDDLRYQPTDEQQAALQAYQEKLRLWLYAELKTDQWRHLCQSECRMRWWKDLTE